MRPLTTMILALAFASLSPRDSISRLFTGKRTDYRLAITNQMPHAMDFFYTDQDTTERLLGTVESASTRVFIIASPRQTTITVIERGDAMPWYDDRRPITLKADSLAEIVF